MKRYFNFYHFIMIVPILLLYSNCDGYKSTDSTLSSLSNCANSASLSLKLLKFDASTDCNDLKLIHCERRVFSPNEDHGENTLESCLESSPYGAICLNITERTYNTTGASSDATEYEPGAAYNYSEVNCYLGRFSHNNKPIFRSSTENLQSSLLALHKQCEEGGSE